MKRELTSITAWRAKFVTPLTTLVAEETNALATTRLDGTAIPILSAIDVARPTNSKSDLAAENINDHCLINVNRFFIPTSNKALIFLERTTGKSHHLLFCEAHNVRDFAEISARILFHRAHR